MFEHTQCSVAGGMLWASDAQPLRIVPVIAASDHAETGALAFEHLIEAAAVLQDQGYAVIVLDGTQAEQAIRNPGLQQLLDPAAGFAQTALPADVPADGSVATLPAARGMVELIAQAARLDAHPLSLLWRYLRRHAVVIVHASAKLLAGLVAGCEQAPIQLMPSAGADTTLAWRDLRHCFKQAELMPHLVAFRAADAGFDAGLRSLSEAALAELGAEPLAEQLDPTQPRQLRRWILQSLERAQCVYPPDYQPEHQPNYPSHDELAHQPVAASSAATPAAAQPIRVPSAVLTSTQNGLSTSRPQKASTGAGDFDHAAAAAVFAAARSRMAAARSLA